MNRIRTGLLFFFSVMFIIPFFNGCSDEAMDGRDEINRQLAADKDVQLLVSIRDEFIGRMAGGDVPLDELQKAYEEGNEQQIIALLLYSRKEIEEINRQLLAAAERIEKRYPSLWAYRTDGSCAACEYDASDFFRNFDRYTKPVNIPRLKNATAEESGSGNCRDYINYALCLLKCVGDTLNYSLCASSCDKRYCM